jgi:hypothetical protein
MTVAPERERRGTTTTMAFEGRSGGARTGFTLSAGDATPGYLPGPIHEGTWAVALGPVVLNPLGMRWRVRAELEHGDGSAAPEAAPLPPPAELPGRTAGWFRGDPHLHTVHSDGRRTPAELACAARAGGLDFVVSTEHNTNAANRCWGAEDLSGLLVIPGEEVTTRHGHWLAVGLAAGDWVDWRYRPRDRLFDRYAGRVRAAGGMVVAAHPALPMPGCAWEFGYRHVDAIEVWNGRWTLDDEAALAGPGEELCVPDGADVDVEATVTGAPGTRLAIRTAAGAVASAVVDRDGAATVGWRGTGDRFVRVEVRRPRAGILTTMVAMSNPIWLSVPGGRSPCS